MARPPAQRATAAWPRREPRRARSAPQLATARGREPGWPRVARSATTPPPAGPVAGRRGAGPVHRRVRWRKAAPPPAEGRSKPPPPPPPPRRPGRLAWPRATGQQAVPRWAAATARRSATRRPATQAHPLATQPEATRPRVAPAPRQQAVPRWAAVTARRSATRRPATQAHPLATRPEATRPRMAPAPRQQAVPRWAAATRSLVISPAAAPWPARREGRPCPPPRARPHPLHRPPRPAPRWSLPPPAGGTANARRPPPPARRPARHRGGTANGAAAPGRGAPARHRATPSRRSPAPPPPACAGRGGWSSPRRLRARAKMRDAQPRTGVVEADLGERPHHAVRLQAVAGLDLLHQGAGEVIVLGDRVGHR